MFENVIELWQQYTAKSAQQWASNDPRHDLSSEVRERLGQLDIVLDYLGKAMASFAGNPEENQRARDSSMQAYSKVKAGEITTDQYSELITQISAKSPEQLHAFVRAGAELRLFAEAFYFFAWRVVEILTGSGPFAFKGFGKLRAHGIRLVRNHLLQHPEKHGQNFSQFLTVTNNGPVLKSAGAIIRTSTGMIDPADESIDRGLFVNAQELHDQMLEMLQRELP